MFGVARVVLQDFEFFAVVCLDELLIKPCLPKFCTSYTTFRSHSNNIMTGVNPAIFQDLQARIDEDTTVRDVSIDPAAGHVNTHSPRDRSYEISYKGLRSRVNHQPAQIECH